MIQVFLNNKPLELDKDIELTYTLNVNDIGDVATRQASYISGIKVPKTPNNVQIMQGLGLAGDTSRMPYQKPICQVMDDGFALITNGWAVIKNTNDYYNLSIYSGVINFFKAIENKTLGYNLDLNLINHQKNVQTVLNSFANPNYKYLLGDYNGRTHYDIDNKILIDYLPPSANVKYLWNLIFSTFGFTYSGTVFNNLNFTDLWLTYPKGVDVNSNNQIQIYDISFGFVPNAGITFNGTSFDVQIGQFISVEAASGSSDPFYSYVIKLYLNGVLAPSGASFQVNTGDNFYTTLQFINPTQPEQPAPNGVLKIFRNGISQSFSEELKDFKITDFVKEIMNKYCLTMFTNDHTNEIVFKTITERVGTNVIIDWTEKYVERKDETYIFDNYSQKNNFKYNYNDKEDAHNDGFISIDNINIAASIDVWKSVTYSPLKETNDSFIVGLGQLPAGQRIFKQYDKEVKEFNSTSPIVEIKYKPLSKRFYFLHSKPEYLPTGNVVFGSVQLSNTQTYVGSLIPVANFNQLDMNSIIGANYLPMQTILNDSRLHTFYLAISKFDVMQLNFDALYYFAQEQQYYLLNKINFKNNDYSTGEFVRVKYYKKYFIKIISVAISFCDIETRYETDVPIGETLNITIRPTSNYTDPNFFFNYNIVVTQTNIDYKTLIYGGDYSIQIKYNNSESNIFVFNNTATCNN